MLYILYPLNSKVSNSKSIYEALVSHSNYTVVKKRGRNWTLHHYLIMKIFQYEKAANHGICVSIRYLLIFMSTFNTTLHSFQKYLGDTACYISDENYDKPCFSTITIHSGALQQHIIATVHPFLSFDS